MKIVKTLAVAATASALVLGTVACGSGDEDVAAPPMYGENGQCYYVQDPAEVAMLQQQGLCASNWVPAPAPDSWLVLWAPHYKSKRYYERYVPEKSRKTYVTQINVYVQKNESRINQATQQRKAADTAKQQQSPAKFTSNNGDRKTSGSTSTTSRSGSTSSKSGRR